ncbi:arginine--tRNA ligase [Halobacillus yeomjeoni]|uniref:arginine--tRNA ligase n=1 Tax=Halobacillus yeomjeoni TaxID=311194 RepID=UPI001CD62229|nr:arginine--tRNA ligase [Halobacillus yeomjeoni]MCA0984169.1 arginine--tRNA ligase [Halobacillus yeomjeoni]
MERHIFALQISHLLGESFSREWVYAQIEIPKQETHGDLAFPCFSLAKHYRKNPKDIAEEISQSIKHDVFESVSATGGFVNVMLNKKFITSHTLNQLLSEPGEFGTHSFGKGKKVVLDLSAPNIAKPFSMGHLRSTVIGNAVANLAEKCGYEPVKINYIGDYGTQFGKLLAAYKRWGNPSLIKENPLHELKKIYVKFHQEAEKNPDLIEEGRQWFRKLEHQDEEAVELWTWFKDVSLIEFNKVYQLLGVSFDLTRGEAYYNDKMEATIELLKENNLLEHSEGAEVVRLDEEGLPPCLIRKSDGTTIYATRDLTAAIDRYQTYAFDESLYVVGHEQTLHFQQIVHVLKKLNFEWADRIQHISFGMMLKDGKKMSTRKGKTILLEEVLKEAIDKARENIEEKNPQLENKDETARQVGVGAVIFHDLKHDRRNDVEFSLDEMLTFEGHTAPYLQYSYVRAKSLLEKGGFTSSSAAAEIDDPEAWSLIKTIRAYPEKIKMAYETYDPSTIAKHLLDLARSFNQYYAKTNIVNSHNKNEKLTLVYAFSLVLKDGLQVLGIETPEKM